MAVPKLTKVVINMGVGEAANDKKHLESALDHLTLHLKWLLNQEMKPNK